jgi:hypothetical protein
MNACHGRQWDADTIERVIAYLTEEENPESPENIWKSLHFMEANDLDLALRYDQLHGYLSDRQSSPVEDAQNLRHSDERSLILALRQIVRENLTRPPLDERQKQEWLYPEREPLRWDAYRMKPLTGRELRWASSEEVEEVNRRIAQIEPGLASAIRLFSEHNARVDSRRELLGQSWIHHALVRLLAHERPDLSAGAVYHLASQLLIEAFDAAQSSCREGDSK